MKRVVLLAGAAILLIWRIAPRRRPRRVPAACDPRMHEALAMVAHELRTPLAAIDYTAAKLPEVSAPADLQSAQDLIHRQVRHATGLLEDLLDNWRIAYGGLELERGTLEMCDVVQDAVNTVEAVVKARHHTLVLSLPEHPVPVCGDRVRLVQMVVNLLTNAAKFTPPAGEIDVALIDDDGDVTVRVRDTGVGIPIEMLAHIFEPFTQLPALSGSSPGLGIGLALVRGIVALHGGTVSVRSDGPGRGAEFVVRLPGAEVATAVA